jgi:hypothetical protein
VATRFGQNRERLRRLVELRLAPRIRARLDASALLQDQFLDRAQDSSVDAG